MMVRTIKAKQHDLCQAVGVLLMALLLTGCAHREGASTSGSRAAPSTSAASGESDVQRRARIRLELASSYLENGQADIALEEIGQVLAINPSYADAYHLRALAYMHIEDFARAEASMERARSMLPRDPDILHNYGWLECRKKQYAKANQWFERALATPGYARRDKTWLSQGLCYMQAGQSQQAEQALLRSYEVAQGNPAVSYHLASVIFGRGDAKRAQPYIREVNRGEFFTPESLWLGIKIERALQEFVSMRKLGERLSNRFPESVQARAFARGAFDD